MVCASMRIVTSMTERRDVCLERRGSVHGCCGIVRVRWIKWVFKQGIRGESIVVVSALGLIGLAQSVLVNSAENKCTSGKYDMANNKKLVLM